MRGLDIILWFPSVLSLFGFQLTIFFMPTKSSSQKFVQTEKEAETQSHDARGFSRLFYEGDEDYINLAYGLQDAVRSLRYEREEPYHWAQFVLRKGTSAILCV